MTKAILVGEEAEEYKRLFGAYRNAINASAEALARHGMESKEFLAADTEAGRLWAAIRKLTGSTGPWWR
jgi:hypothetical protein